MKTRTIQKTVALLNPTYQILISRKQTIRTDSNFFMTCFFRYEQVKEKRQIQQPWKNKTIAVDIFSFLSSVDFISLVGEETQREKATKKTFDPNSDLLCFYKRWRFVSVSRDLWVWPKKKQKKKHLLWKKKIKRVNRLNECKRVRHVWGGTKRVSCHLPTESCALDLSRSLRIKQLITSLITFPDNLICIILFF